LPALSRDAPHSDLHPFPTRRSSDLLPAAPPRRRVRPAPTRPTAARGPEGCGASPSPARPFDREAAARRRAKGPASPDGGRRDDGADRRVVGERGEVDDRLAGAAPAARRKHLLVTRAYAFDRDAMARL